jgi:hypothetical protein
VHDGGRVEAAAADENHWGAGRLGGTPARQLVCGQLLLLLLLLDIWAMLLFCMAKQQKCHGW